MNKKKIKKIGTYAITAVVLVLGIFIVKKFWPHEYGCEASNFGAGNWASFDGENYYFLADGNINKLDKKGNVTCLRQNNDGNELRIAGLNLVGDWLFYKKKYLESQKEKMDVICKMRLDGTEEQEVVAERSINYFFVIDHKIYFATRTEEGSEIFVVSDTGKNKRLVPESEIKSESRMDAQFRLNGKTMPEYEPNYSRYGAIIGEQYEGDWFYMGEIIEDADYFYHLRHMSLEGKVDERIVENITDFLVRKEGIYCGKEKNGKVYLSKLNHDGSGEEVVLNKEFTYLRRINYVGEKLFFFATTNEELSDIAEYCVNADGTDLQKICDDKE